MVTRLGMRRRFSRTAQSKGSPTRSPQSEILEKVSRLALLYAADDLDALSMLRFYRDQIKAGKVETPKPNALPEERWVLHLGFRQLDEAWVDAEIERHSPHAKRSLAG